MPVGWLLQCFDMEVRRTQWAPTELEKQALRRPKNAHYKPKSIKNVRKDGIGDQYGRLHIDKQDLTTGSGRLKTFKGGGGVANRCLDVRGRGSGRRFVIEEMEVHYLQVSVVSDMFLVLLNLIKNFAEMSGFVRSMCLRTACFACACVGLPPHLHGCLPSVSLSSCWAYRVVESKSWSSSGSAHAQFANGHNTTRPKCICPKPISADSEPKSSRLSFGEALSITE